MYQQRACAFVFYKPASSIPRDIISLESICCECSCSSILVQPYSDILSLKQNEQTLHIIITVHDTIFNCWIFTFLVTYSYEGETINMLNMVQFDQCHCLITMQKCVRWTQMPPQCTFVYVFLT